MLHCCCLLNESFKAGIGAVAAAFQAAAFVVVLGLVWDGTLGQHAKTSIMFYVYAEKIESCALTSHRPRL